MRAAFYAARMGESRRLRVGTQRVLEAMLRHPERDWTMRAMRWECNDSEKAVEQSVEVLLGTRAGTAVVAGTPTQIDPTWPLGYDYTFRLTDEGPRILRQVLEESRYSGGVIAAFVFEGWEPAKTAWQARRFRGIMRGWRPDRQKGSDSLTFDPMARQGPARLLNRVRQRPRRRMRGSTPWPPPSDRAYPPE